MGTPVKKEHFKMVVSAHLFLIKEGNILLLRRANTGYEDGKYSVVAGHADGGEAVKHAMTREAQEEAGISVWPKDLRLALILHRLDDREQIDFFFEAKKWEDEIQNREPEKCSDLSWFPLNALPENTIPYIRKAIEAYQNGVNYLEIGFDGYNASNASNASNYLSYLMGAPKIKDKELTSLGVKIVGTTPAGNRKLEIPAESLEKFEKLIIEKMNPGFWCDIVGRGEIIFIFKFLDGEVRRYVLSEENRLEIARLCSQFSRDPLAKTSDVLGYLAGNDFYRDFINAWYNKSNLERK